MKCEYAIAPDYPSSMPQATLYQFPEHLPSVEIASSSLLSQASSM